MDKIAILGCGWLGMPLAKKLVSSGYSVVGSTTSPDKLSEIDAIGATPFEIKLYESEISGDIVSFLANADVLIINVPPQRKTQSEFTYKLKTLIPFIEKSAISKVVFVSSTSVYSDNNLEVNEKSVLNPDSESGKDLAKSEQLLSSNKNFKTTIIRFGGLIGETRNPVKYLSGRPLENPKAPINLIHQHDCIGIIESIIKQNIWGKVFNGVTPFHPSREDYYIEKAKQVGCPPPVPSSGKSTGKTVLSNKLTSVLNYIFIHPTL